MFKKIILFTSILLFCFSSLLLAQSKNSPSLNTTLEIILKNGKLLDNKISTYLEKEYKEGRFRRTTTIEDQNKLMYFIANEIINKYDKLKVIGCVMETWGEPGDLDYMLAKIVVECTECPDNVFSLEYTYRVLKVDQGPPVQPDKSVKI
jgi:hypothetical protein